MNTNSSYFLNGENVGLRGVRHKDMEHYRRWLSDSEITHFLEMGVKPLSDEDMNELFNVLTNSSENIAFIVVEKQSDQPIGVAGLYAINWVCRRADFRIILGETEKLGKGLGTEVTNLLITYGFETLNLATITLGVNAENKRATRSYEKSGFQPEGLRRQMIYRNGRYYDILQMSILRDEYYGRK
jgi:RimJ/RimL family protein N-acetyltransferase